MGEIRPRIAFVIHDLCVQDAQYVTALLVRGFHAKGYDVDVKSRDALRGWCQTVRKEGC